MRLSPFGWAMLFNLLLWVVIVAGLVYFVAGLVYFKNHL